MGDHRDIYEKLRIAADELTSERFKSLSKGIGLTADDPVVKLRRSGGAKQEFGLRERDPSPRQTHQPVRKPVQRGVVKFIYVRLIDTVVVAFCITTSFFAASFALVKDATIEQVVLRIPTKIYLMMGPARVVAAFVALYLCYWIGFRLIAGSTLAESMIRRRSSRPTPS